MVTGRIYKDGANWYTDLRFNGHRVRKMVGPSRDIAAKVMQAEVGRLTLAEHGIIEDQKVTLADFAPEYLASKRQVLRPRSFKRVEGILRGNLLPTIGHQFLFNINAGQFYEYRSARLKAGVSNASLNRELSALKNCLTVAVQCGKLKANPLAGVGLLKEAPGRLRFLSADEIKRLLDCCAHHLRPIVLTAVLTGMRKGEILSLRWEYVKLGERLLVLPLTKNNSTRVLPIPEALAVVLEGMPTREGFVFCHADGTRYGDIKRAWASAGRRAGIADFRFHDLRHTYASQMVMRGVHLRALQELLGHKSLAMTQRYAHLSREALQSAVKLIDGLVP